MSLKTDFEYFLTIVNNISKYSDFQIVDNHSRLAKNMIHTISKTVVKINPEPLQERFSQCQVGRNICIPSSGPSTGGTWCGS